MKLTITSIVFLISAMPLVCGDVLGQVVGNRAPNVNTSSYITASSPLPNGQMIMSTTYGDSAYDSATYVAQAQPYPNQRYENIPSENYVPRSFEQPPMTSQREFQDGDYGDNVQTNFVNPAAQGYSNAGNPNDQGFRTTLPFNTPNQSAANGGYLANGYTATSYNATGYNNPNNPYRATYGYNYPNNYGGYYPPSYGAAAAGNYSNQQPALSYQVAGTPAGYQDYRAGQSNARWQPAVAGGAVASTASSTNDGYRPEFQTAARTAYQNPACCNQPIYNGYVPQGPYLPPGGAMTPPAGQNPYVNPYANPYGPGYAPSTRQTWTPLIPFRNLPPGTYVGQGIIGQPVAYVDNEPFRNFLRYISP
jgi:hypothetical protein